MPKALIVYASWTGNSREIAELLGGFLEEQNTEVRIFECQQIDAAAFLEADICVVSTYTYGSEGSLPYEIEDFYEDLGSLDLTGKIFGALGSGEKFYGYYCKSVDDFDRQFESTGATRGADVVKVELAPDEKDKERIKQFAEALVNSLDLK